MLFDCGWKQTYKLTHLQNAHMSITEMIHIHNRNCNSKMTSDYAAKNHDFIACKLYCK